MSVDGDSESEIPETSRKQYFCWHYGNNGTYPEVGGVGRVAFSVIKDFIQRNPQMDIDEINKALVSHKRTIVYTEDTLPDVKRCFSKDPILHQGKNLFVSNQWSASRTPILWSDFKDKMKSHGYSIDLCYLVGGKVIIS